MKKIQLGVFVFLCSHVAFCFPAAAEDQNAIFQLNVNQVEKQTVFVILRPQDILVSRADLEQAGLKNFSGNQEMINNETYVSLASLAPSISYSLDETELKLSITAVPELLGNNSFTLNNTSPQNITYRQDTSAFLNYSVKLPLELPKFPDINNYTLFAESGFSSNNKLLYSSFSQNSQGDLMRNVTNFTFSQPEKLTKWVIGDSFASTDNLGGATFMAGVSVSRDFGLNPYFIQQPTFTLSGAVLTPSTVDILVNGQRISQQKVPPGQFQFHDLLLPTGSGSIQLVIRDALGREEIINSPFYLTAGLLKPGLSDYSFNLGWRRTQLNSDSFNYSHLAFVGRYNQGITKLLTLGGRLEASGNLISGGLNLTTALPFGALQLSIASSSQSGSFGSAGALTYSYSARGWGFGASVRSLSDQYAHLSLTASEDRPRLENNAFASVSPSRNFTLGLQYASSHFRDQGQRNRLVLTGNLRLNSQADLFMNLTHAKQPTQPTTNEIFIGLNYTLGNSRATLGQRNTNGKATTTSSLSVQKSTPLSNGFGYRLQIDPTDRQIPSNANIQYRSGFGVYDLYLNRGNDGKITSSINLSGGIIFTNNQLFFSPPVNQSFALIQVPGVRGVRGYVNNQERGRTDSRGNLVVDNLLPYRGNNIKIQSEDIPFNYNIEAEEQVIASSFRGGSVVRFPLQLVQAVIGSLTIETPGKIVIPSYGQLNITVNNKIISSPIGNEGDFYLDNIPPGSYPANIDYEQGMCNFDLTIPQSNEQILELGKLKCILP